MSVNLSLSEIVGNLQERIDSLREQKGLHARQEEYHRDQGILIEAELQKAARQLESLQDAAAVAADLDFPSAAPPPPPQEENLESHRALPRMVKRVVADRPEGERFGPKLVAQEVNRRFRKSLRRPVDARAVSVVLRRMSTARSIHLVREGKPNHEALYTRGVPQSST